MPVPRFFLPPPLGDKDDGLAARKVWSVLVSLALFVTVMVPLTCLFLPDQVLRMGLIMGTADTGIVLLLLLCRRHPVSASVLLVIMGALIFGASAATAGGIRSPSMMGFLVITALAGVLLGARAAAAAGVLSILSGLALMLAEESGFLPAIQIHHTPVSRWWIFTILVVMAVMLEVVVDWVVVRTARKAAQLESAKAHAEEALLESEQHLRRLFATMNSGFSLHEIVCDAAGRPCDYRFLEVNPAFETLTGLKARDIVGRRVLEVLPKTEPYWIDRFCAVAVTGSTDRFQNYSRELGRHYEVVCYSPKRGQFAVLSFDVTERVRHEEAIRERELRFLRLIENASDVITIVDAAHVITYQSPSIERALGYKPADMVGRDLFMLVHPEDVDQARSPFQEAFLRPGSVVEGEYRVLHSNGTWRAFASVGKNIPGEAQMVINSRDVTDQRALEMALRQSQKIEAVGRLSGGIAHDFNNLLTAMKGYGFLLEGSRDMGARERDHLREMLGAVDRAARLTSQLLAFSRQQDATLRPVMLNTLVASMFGLLQHMLGETISMDLRLSESALRIRADTGMIEQVLLNLAVNARDAMPEGGALTVSTEPCVLSEAQVALLCPGASVGAYARLTVADTGCGMAPEVQQRIFEPFFTTKAVGSGTGLGLAMVHGIVRQHGGWVTVRSAPGEGACFEVCLPLAGEEQDTASAPPPEVSDPAPGRSETILVVEDEAAVRDLVILLLKRQGYRTLAAGDGFQGMVLWREHRESIRMLLTDVVMPGGMGGHELARRVLRDNPALPVICMSGYLPSRGEIQEGPPAGAVLLRKPFSPEELANLVRAGLDGVRP